MDEVSGEGGSAIFRWTFTGTNTGPGGTGKTRLAVGTAAVMADRFTDGAVFVELAPLRDPEFVPSAIAAALGVAESPGEPIVVVLHRTLAERAMLIVLDNLEQLLPAAAPTVSDLVRAAPRIHVLI